MNKAQAYGQGAPGQAPADQQAPQGADQAQAHAHANGGGHGGAYAWGPPPGYGVPPYSGMPPYAWQPPYYAAPQPPNYAAQSAWAVPPAGFTTAQADPNAAAGNAAMAAALGDMADKNGLGMFKNLFNLEDGDFWKGAIVGAAAVLLLTNENLRSSLIGGMAKTAEAVKSGLAGFGSESEEADSADDEAGAEQAEKSSE
ncbi:MAG: hypothetical protein PVG66_07085 [Chromatiales bacterium]|jgi:hypothetical protein